MVANPLTPIGKLVVVALLLLRAPVYWIATTWFPAWRGGDPGVSKFPADSEFPWVEFDLSSRRSRIGFFVCYYLLPPIRYFALFLLCGAVATPFRV